jgi:hypothetical protein
MWNIAAESGTSINRLGKAGACEALVRVLKAYKASNLAIVAQVCVLV